MRCASLRWRAVSRGTPRDAARRARPVQLWVTGAAVLPLIERVLGRTPTTLSPLSGGCVAQVYLARMGDGERLVVKVDAGPRAMLDREAFMLELLRERSELPVPQVIACDLHVLAMEYIESSGGASEVGEVELAEAVARLHGVEGQAYGLERDTLIGPLEQPNSPSEDWAGFFAEHRVRAFARLAYSGGNLSLGLRDRCFRLADRAADLLEGAEPACLVHGDLWAGNVLWRDGRLAGVIDPATYYADREVELAFMDLFGSLGASFWQRYEQIRPIRSGFWELRRHAYKVYPLLVHVHLFGGSYAGQLDRELGAAGC